MERRVLTIVGPTASGKSKLGLILAQKLNSEIISADSRQIYKELNIGTAKPNKKDLEIVKHHFINHISITENFDVGRFVREAKEIINYLHEQNKIPIIVGGTGLYVNSLLYGIFEGPSANNDVRERLKKLSDTYGLNYLVNLLKEVDPITYKRIDKNNFVRVIRALEVYFLTGVPISKLQREKHVAPDFENFIFGLQWDRKMLYERINARVLSMLDNGLIDEVRNILNEFGEDINIVLQTVGYEECIQFIKGKISLDEMIMLIQRNTRRYAKRQLTWFRKDKNIYWLDINSENDFNDISNYIIQKISEGKNER